MRGGSSLFPGNEGTRSAMRGLPGKMAPPECEEMDSDDAADDESEFTLEEVLRLGGTKVRDRH